MLDIGLYLPLQEYILRTIAILYTDQVQKFGKIRESILAKILINKIVRI